MTGMNALDVSINFISNLTGMLDDSQNRIDKLTTNFESTILKVFKGLTTNSNYANKQFGSLSRIFSLFYNKNIDLNKAYKLQNKERNYLKDSSLLGEIFDTVVDLNKELVEKNSLHKEQNKLLGNDVKLVDELKDQFGVNNNILDDGVKKIIAFGTGIAFTKKAFNFMINDWKSIRNSVYEVDKLAANFTTTNYRLYDSQYGLTQASLELAAATGMASEKAIETVKALSDLATPKLQMKQLGDSILKANQYLGIAIGDLADFSRENRLAGGDINGFNRIVGYSSAAMKKYGLTTGDVNSTLKATKVTSTDLAIIFGKMINVNGKQVSSLEAYKKAQLSVAGAAKQLGYDASLAADAIDKVVGDDKARMNLLQFGNELGIALEKPNDYIYGMPALISKAAERTNLSLEEMLAPKRNQLEVTQYKAKLASISEMTGGLTSEQIRMQLELAEAAKKAGRNIANVAQMQEFMEAKQDGIDPFNESLNTLTGQIGLVYEKFKALGQMVNVFFGSGLRDMFKLIKPIFDDIAYALNTIAEGFSAFGRDYPVLAKILTGIGTFARLFLSAIPFLLGVYRVVRLVWAGLKALAITFTFLSGPIGWAVAALVGLSAAFYFLYKNSETFRKGIDGLWQAIKGFFKSVADWVYNVAEMFTLNIFESWPILIKDMSDSIKTLLNGIYSFVKFFVYDLRVMVAKGLNDGIESLFGIDIGQMIYDRLLLPIYKILGIASPSKVMFDIGINIITGLYNGIISSINSIAEAGKKIFNYFIEELSSFIGNVYNVGVKVVNSLQLGIMSSASYIYDIGKNFILYMVDGIMSSVRVLSGAARQAIDLYLSGISSFLGLFKNAGIQLVNMLFAGLTSIYDNIGLFKNMGVQLVSKFFSGITSFYKKISSFPSNVISMIKNGLQSGFNSLRSIGISLVNTIIDSVKASIKNVINIGRDFVQGLWSGITAMGTSLYNNITTFIYDNTIGAVKQALGISSPSKVMADIATNIMQSFVDNILNYTGLGIVYSFFEGIAGAIGSLFGKTDAEKAAENVEALTGLIVPVKFGEDYYNLMTNISEGSKLVIDTKSIEEFGRASKMLVANLFALNLVPVPTKFGTKYYNLMLDMYNGSTLLEKSIAMMITSFEQLSAIPEKIAAIDFANIGNLLKSGLAQMDVSEDVGIVINPISKLTSTMQSFSRTFQAISNSAYDSLKSLGPEIRGVLDKGLGKVAAETISKVQLTTNTERSEEARNREPITLKNVVEKLEIIRTENKSIGERMLGILDEQLAEMRNRQHFTTNYNSWVS